MPTQPATLTATRVATKATRTFFIGVPLSFTPTRGTLSCFAAPLVARRSQWFTGSGDVGALQKGLCLWGHSYAACAAKPAVAAYRFGGGRRPTVSSSLTVPPCRYVDQFTKRSATHGLHAGSGRKGRWHVEN